MVLGATVLALLGSEEDVTSGHEGGAAGQRGGSRAL